MLYPTPDSGVRQVLVLDDHAMLVEAIENDIRAKLPAFRVVGVGTIREAEAICRSTPPDIALVDWSLPDGDGFELAARLAKVLPTVRWIGLTATHNAEATRSAAACGLHGLVMKSASLEVIRNAIVAVSSQRFFFCQRSRALMSDTRELLVQRHLTPRERTIFASLKSGQSAKEIAFVLKSKDKTIRNQMRSLRLKLTRLAVRHSGPSAPTEPSLGDTDRPFAG